jgi:hypothetical protein
MGKRDLHRTGMIILKWILDMGLYAWWGEMSLTFSGQSYRTLECVSEHALRVMNLKWRKYFRYINLLIMSFWFHKRETVLISSRNIKLPPFPKKLLYSRWV